MHRRDRVVQGLRFLVEPHFRALQHGDARAQRLELTRDKRMAQPRQSDFRWRWRDRLEVARQVSGRRLDLRQRNLGVLGLDAPLGRAVIRVHVIGIVLTQREDEPHIPLGERVHVAAGAARTRAHPHVRRARHRGSKNEGEDKAARGQYRSLIVGIRYSENARAKSYAGEYPQSRRAALSSTSAGQESTIA